MKRKLFLLALLLSAATQTSADCLYSGRLYPDGTIIGPYICSGEQWVRQ